MLHCYLDRYAIPAEQAFSSAGLPHGKLKGMLLVETADASENIIKATFSYPL
jgi:mannose-6-phosphate isomerase class I